MKFGLSDTVISELQGVFRRHPNIQEVIIFGSRAKGNYREGSDIDLAAVGNNLDYNQLLSILIEIDDLELLYHIAADDDHERQAHGQSHRLDGGVEFIAG